jgi:H2-forming N5,N10-methylenetetrahydromethanopterin dehydrogenase-like enzyme
MSAPEVFRKITATLDGAGIAYMLTGSFAGAYYGAARSTQGIDLVIEATAEQVRTLVEDLGKADYYADLDAAVEAHRQRSLFNVIDVATGWRIDFIIRKSRAFSQEEFRRRQSVDLQGVAVMVTSAEDLVIAKLEWAKLGQSQRQVEDVAAILRMRWLSLDRSYVET